MLNLHHLKEGAKGLHALQKEAAILRKESDRLWEGSDIEEFHEVQWASIRVANISSKFIRNAHRGSGIVKRGLVAQHCPKDALNEHR